MAIERDQVFNIRMDADDRALLDAISEVEKLPRADVIRRAVREYAKKLKIRLPKK